MAQNLALRGAILHPDSDSLSRSKTVIRAGFIGLPKIPSLQSIANPEVAFNDRETQARTDGGGAVSWAERTARPLAVTTSAKKSCLAPTIRLVRNCGPRGAIAVDNALFAGRMGRAKYPKRAAIGDRRVDGGAVSRTLRLT